MKDRIMDTINLSTEIIKELELKDLQLSTSLLKCIRLAQLINDNDAIKWMKLEAEGYPAYNLNRGHDVFLSFLYEQINNQKDESIKANNFVLKNLRLSKRITSVDKFEGKYSKILYIGESISELEINYQQISEINYQNPFPDSYRHNLEELKQLSIVFEQVKMRLYDYASNIYFELNYNNIIRDIFDDRRNMVDIKLKDLCPDSLRKFVSAYDNLKSDNQEDWSNAVHSCRRILKDLADVLYPPDDTLKDEMYIKRLKKYVKNKTGSDSHSDLIEAQINSMETLIQKLYQATNKGSHNDISKKEAETYVIMTHFLIGDILLM